MSKFICLVILATAIPAYTCAISNQIESLQKQGVIFVRPDFVVIDEDVTIGPRTTIGCGAHILNGSKIGCDCTIEAFCVISNSTVEDHAVIHSHTVIEDSHVKSNASVGPFARLRKQSSVESEAEVGNFVELSDSTVGKKSKAKHLTYLGCTTVEESVNIGAGTITCNYDGYKRHKTVFGSHAFIGSNSTFVAPISVGSWSVTAAGCTYTKDIPENCLAINRGYQTNKDNYAPQLRRRLKNRAEAAS